MVPEITGHIISSMFAKNDRTFGNKNKTKVMENDKKLYKNGKNTVKKRTFILNKRRK